MNIHKNARLTPKGREILISRLERGEHPLDVATAMGISTSTVYKWWRRYRAEGFGGLIKFGTPFGKVFHHLDAPLPSFSPLR